MLDFLNKGLSLRIPLGIWMTAALALSACSGVAESGRTEIEGLPGAFTYSKGRTANVDLFQDAGDLLANHHFEAAESVYRQIISLEPENESGYVGLGSSLFFQERYDEARQAYEAAARLAPESAEAFVGLGSVASRTGDLVGAADHYSRALDLDEHSADAHWGLALALVAQGDPERAISHLERVIELVPGSTLADLAKSKLEDLRADSRP